MSGVLDCAGCGAHYRFGEGYIYDMHTDMLYCRDCAEELLAELEEAELEEVEP